MAADNSSQSTGLSLDSLPTTPTSQSAPKRPSLSRNSSSASKYFVETPRAMASGIWDFCKYGPDIPDSHERKLSAVPEDPAKRRLPWKRWEGW
ncbi:hypothetical protein SLS58_006489 [Diplodia intermedia]|uniref:Uncharacterized protein n=1 Tax=Diplodia intermedia TaxID=856260 RepID=A0ABR3TN51_9PEZI